MPKNPIDQFREALPVKDHILLSPINPPTISDLEWENRDHPCVWHKELGQLTQHNTIPVYIEIYIDTAYGLIALFIDGHLMDWAKNLITYDNLAILGPSFTGSSVKVYRELK